MYEKEHSAVSFITVFLGFGLTIMLTLLIPTFVVSKTVLNTDFIEKQLTGKATSRLLTVALNEEFEKAVKDEGIILNDDDYNVFDDNMSKQFLKIINDKITTGKYDPLDVENLSNDISDSVEKLLDAYDDFDYADTSSIRDLRDEITDSLHSAVGEMDTDISAGLSKASSAVNIAGGIMAVICFIIAFIIIIIHKKKYRGFKATGIALFISGLISTTAIAFILFALYKAMGESLSKEDLPDYVYSSLIEIFKSFGKPVMIYAASFLVAGLVLIIVTEIMDKSYKAATGYPGNYTAQNSGQLYSTNVNTYSSQNTTYTNTSADYSKDTSTDSFNNDWDETYSQASSKTADSYSTNFDADLEKIKNEHLDTDINYQGFDFTDTSSYTSTNIDNLGSSDSDKYSL